MMTHRVRGQVHWDNCDGVVVELADVTVQLGSSRLPTRLVGHVLDGNARCVTRLYRFSPKD